MSDLCIRVERHSEPLDPIFPRILGPAFASLPDPIRAAHLTPGTSRWHGRATVTQGTGRWGRLIAALFRFPPATGETAVEVTKTTTAQGETWTRRFGTRPFRSHLKATPRGMTERFGPFTFLLDLRVQDGELHYPVAAGFLGPVPLPHWLLPGSAAHEHVESGRFHFDVRLTAQIARGLIVHYRGWLQQGCDDHLAPPAPRVCA
jgi:hypothetical protein